MTIPTAVRRGVREPDPAVTPQAPSAMGRGSRIGRETVLKVQVLLAAVVVLAGVVGAHSLAGARAPGTWPTPHDDRTPSVPCTIPATAAAAWLTRVPVTAGQGRRALTQAAVSRAGGSLPEEPGWWGLTCRDLHAAVFTGDTAGRPARRVGAVINRP